MTRRTTNTGCYTLPFFRRASTVKRTAKYTSTHTASPHPFKDLLFIRVDLLALSASKLSTASPEHSASPAVTTAAPPVVPASVPNGSMMGQVKIQKGFAAPTNGGHPVAISQANGSAPKARRMSSTTATSLGRGKLGLLGGDIVENKEMCVASLLCNKNV